MGNREHSKHAHSEKEWLVCGTARRSVWFNLSTGGLRGKRSLMCVDSSLEERAGEKVNYIKVVMGTWVTSGQSL